MGQRMGQRAARSATPGGTVASGRYIRQIRGYCGDHHLMRILSCNVNGRVRAALGRQADALLEAATDGTLELQSDDARTGDLFRAGLRADTERLRQALAPPRRISDP